MALTAFRLHAGNSGLFSGRGSPSSVGGARRKLPRLAAVREGGRCWPELLAVHVFMVPVLQEENDDESHISESDKCADHGGRSRLHQCGCFRAKLLRVEMRPVPLLPVQLWQ